MLLIQINPGLLTNKVAQRILWKELNKTSSNRAKTMFFLRTLPSHLEIAQKPSTMLGLQN
jgi:hypothetical protein